MINNIQKKYALSEQGAADLLKGCAACTLHNLSLMLPAGLLYYLVIDLLQNGGINSASAWYIVSCLVCLVLIYISARFQYNTTFFSTYIESGVRRIALGEKLRKIPLSFYGKKNLADLTSTIMADCAFLEKAFSHFIPELIGAIFFAVICAIFLFWADWRMAIATLWVLPLSFCIIRFSMTVQDTLGARQMDAKMACADGIQECLETVRDLKACNAEDDYLTGLEEKIRMVEKRAVISELGMTAFMASASLLLKLGIATTALTGAYLLMNGSLELSVFFLFLLVVSRLYDPLLNALQNLMGIILTRPHIQRMKEILNHPVQEGEQHLSNIGFTVEFENVEFSYNNNEHVLKGVTFTAAQGEVTALVGPSGGGKTTVARLAARFWEPTCGKITIGGMDITKTDPERLLSLFSIVFQDVTLFDNTIMENIRLGRENASDEEVLKAAKLANCDEFANKLPDGWNSLIGENGFALSGGERQRISIARAILKDAPIILLDEATASLDVKNETLIQTALSHLIRKKTVLVIAHRMRTVAGADKIVVLDNGVIAEQGPPRLLMNKMGLFRKMVELQIQTGAWSLKEA